ncbi:MAG: hypothetical protein WCJ30_25125, partial [Deltaproteobacteria bacterium]
MTGFGLSRRAALHLDLLRIAEPARESRCRRVHRLVRQPKPKRLARCLPWQLEVIVQRERRSAEAHPDEGQGVQCRPEAASMDDIDSDWQRKGATISHRTA